MENLWHFRNNVKTENSLDERSKNFQTIPKNDNKKENVTTPIKTKKNYRGTSVNFDLVI